ncbi:hypothetical protein ACA910_006818 [Epithemia clementina (nom. ined.)]
MDVFTRWMGQSRQQRRRRGGGGIISGRRVVHKQSPDTVTTSGFILIYRFLALMILSAILLIRVTESFSSSSPLAVGSSSSRNLLSSSMALSRKRWRKDNVILLGTPHSPPTRCSRDNHRRVWPVLFASSSSSSSSKSSSLESNQFSFPKTKTNNRKDSNSRSKKKTYSKSGTKNTNNSQKAPPFSSTNNRKTKAAVTTLATPPQQLSSTTTTIKQTWRLYGIEVHPDDLKWDPKTERQSTNRNSSNNNHHNSNSSSVSTSANSTTLPAATFTSHHAMMTLHPSVLNALYQKYPPLAKIMDGSAGVSSKRPSNQQGGNDRIITVDRIHVVRRSLDARRYKTRSDGKGKGPRFVYVLDIDLRIPAAAANDRTSSDGSSVLSFWKHQPGKLELLHNPEEEQQEDAFYYNYGADDDSVFMTDNHDMNSARTTLIDQEKTSTGRSSDNNKDADARPNNKNNIQRVIIVGAGPAGLFCALELLDHNDNYSRHISSNGHNPPTIFQPIILERGQPVERRGKDIGAIMAQRRRRKDTKQTTTTPGDTIAHDNPNHEMDNDKDDTNKNKFTSAVILNPDSNFCFGEGGAGTWSDGKLTTRIGRNSGSVRRVLSTLVRYGAPSSILTEGAPHLGTDNLVKILRHLRQSIIQRGGQVWFGTQMTRLVYDNDIKNKVVGVEYKHTEKEQQDQHQENVGLLHGDAVVLATGHSARDVYEILAETSSGAVTLESKGFAVGFRIEHPQSIVNQLQYGTEWGPSVRTGKTTTDTLNEKHFSSLLSSLSSSASPLSSSQQVPEDSRRHENDTSENPHERLPVPSYRLATDQAWDGSRHRGVYSFCMCPGGQIVPSSTDPTELCVNGMSFSRRDSQWANSALVVAIGPDDPILEPYRAKHGALAGLAFQRDMERRAAAMGSASDEGGQGTDHDLTVPVQRVTDFLQQRVSASIPSSSYRLGVRSAPCHDIYPPAITSALCDALVNSFNTTLPGFVCQEALLHGVETRTSSPVRIARDKDTLQATGVEGLFPAGEGAGFAGGIVSAAVDGLSVGQAIVDQLQLSHQISNDVEQETGNAKEKHTRLERHHLLQTLRFRRLSSFPVRPHSINP